MAEKSWTVQIPAVAGLFFRIGKHSWFWGRGNPHLMTRTKAEDGSAPNAPSQPEPWSNVARWLRDMHAQALPSPSQPQNAAQVQLTQEHVPSPPPDSRAQRKIRFVCNRRFVGFIVG